jgi:hypothetical protein
MNSFHELCISCGQHGNRRRGKAVSYLVFCALLLLPATSIASERFDGNWSAVMTCPPKGDTEGYTWKLTGAITNGNFRGEHGTAGQPGYLLVEGRIGQDGSAKLSANGIVASRKYARGVFAHQGENYSYDIKAQFKETTGTGTKSEGLGIVGRTCTFDFVKQDAVSQPVPGETAPR